MDSETEKRVEAIFHEALNKESPQEREAFIDGACGGDETLIARVKRLLSAHEEADHFLEPVEADGEPGRSEEGPGTKIGPYKLLQKIGEGGFGMVYMAEQVEPVRRKVALKIIKLGMDSKQVIARFEAERQALALMDHPNIARVFDAGATDSGRPYFVMELVQGVPITEYCDKARLTTKDRLKLFAQVCRAIHHAHQKGIIHRDIKPTNVMVTLHDGVPVPKVIDFGVAKAMDRTLTERTLFTEYGQVIGTPEYMSPEQAEMSGLDIDTRTDIYSLGALLYEVLTGRTPLDIKSLLRASYSELIRVIQEVEPPRPSHRVSTLGQGLELVAKQRQISPKLLSKLLKGEIDWIVMKALAKERSRRYGSADTMAADIENYLSHKPVTAGPPGTLYRMRKFVRRNQVAVTAGLLVLTALVVGLGLATIGFLEAQRQRAEAVAERDHADKLRIAEETARRLADRKSEEAEQKAREALEERNAKERALVEKEKALKRSKGMRLLAQSQAILPDNPSLALLLAIEGEKHFPGHVANSMLLAALEEAPQRELVLDSTDVVDARYSPRDNRVATAHGDGTVRVWDADNGGIIHVLRGHEGKTRKIFWVKQGDWIISYGDDDVIRVWDIVSGDAIYKIGADEASASTMTVSADGRRASTNKGRGDCVYVWDLENEELEWRLKVKNVVASHKNLNFSPCGDFLLTGELRSDGPYLVHLWDLRSGERLHTWSSRLNMSAKFSPDGRTVLADSNDGQVCLWDAISGKEVRKFDVNQSNQYFLEFSTDGAKVITSDKKAIRIWDTESGDLIHEFAGREIIMSRDGERLLVKKSEKDPEIRNLKTGELMYTLKSNGNPSDFSPDGKRVLTLWAGFVRIIDPIPGRERMEFQEKCHTSILFANKDVNFIVSAPHWGKYPIRLWNLKSRCVVHVFNDHLWVRVSGEQKIAVPWLAFSPDGKRIATSGHDGHFSIWDRETAERILNVPCHEGPVWSIDFSPDGKRIVTSGADLAARVWDAESGKLLITLGEPAKPGYWFWLHRTWAGFSPDGKQILTRLDSRKTQVWDAATGRLFMELNLNEDGRVMNNEEGLAKRIKNEGGDREEIKFGRVSGNIGYTSAPGFPEVVIHAAYSPDGSLIKASGGGADVPKGAETSIWDARTGKLLHVLEGGVYSSQPYSCFSPDGSQITAGVHNEGVRIYEIASGKCHHTLPVSAGNARYAFFSQDGRYVLAEAEGRVFVWEAAKGTQVLQLEDCINSYFVPSACFSPDSKSVLQITKEDRLRMIPLNLLQAALEHKPRELTAAERAQYKVD
ncbi:MAG: protein kinase domain-containing protein [Planctomycetota bacterium]|jgi:WD40 repeat protein/serine/threonine protein kinase